MKHIELDALQWTTQDDFFKALLHELGAPGWHGHNLNALWDGITSDINEVVPPYAVSVRHAHSLDSDLKNLFEGVSKVFADARRKRHLDVWFNVA